jgi:hypothetical protein
MRKIPLFELFKSENLDKVSPVFLFFWVGFLLLFVGVFVNFDLFILVGGFLSFVYFLGITIWLVNVK